MMMKAICRNLAIGALFGVGLAAAPSAHAVLMVGGVSLGGSFTPNNVNLALATQVSIGPVAVGGATGTFSAEGIVFGSPASFSASNPLVFSPITLPGGILYSFGTAGDPTRFEFTLTSLNLENQTSTDLDFTGTGMFHDNNGVYEDTDGTWNASLDKAGTGTLATFGFSSSSATVPDGGATLALFGVSLLGIGGVRRFLAKKA